MPLPILPKYAPPHFHAHAFFSELRNSSIRTLRRAYAAFFLILILFTFFLAYFNLSHNYPSSNKHYPSSFSHRHSHLSLSSYCFSPSSSSPSPNYSSDSPPPGTAHSQTAVFLPPNKAPSDHNRNQVLPHKVQVLQPNYSSSFSSPKPSLVIGSSNHHNYDDTTPQRRSPGLSTHESANHKSEALNKFRNHTTIAVNDLVKNSTSSPMKKGKYINGTDLGLVKHGVDELIKPLMDCDMFDGKWVRDESYPLYKPGSCSLIDEQFNCFLNGRPDHDYHKLKWKPKGCTLPRLDGKHMLELLKGKRLVFVGDSLNRNMWESLICILRNSVKDRKKVYEKSSRQNFRREASFSFVFEEYNSTVELFVAPFLVQEWEVTGENGRKKETLRLDMMSRYADKYKDADIVVFNTGHWWSHEKTSTGKDYYQEGNHVYPELDVLEAYRKALTTWGRWIDANADPLKSLVFFRGYSASHFSGGQWNSGGQCDSETGPIKEEKYLTQYPRIMSVLENVLHGMKTEVTYLNVTRMTDYRKDGHPSIYRKRGGMSESEEERRWQLRIQDCSHWCLPGVPDAWNEILYAQLQVRLKQKRLEGDSGQFQQQ